jgi:3-hydroxy-9,10-secoandrosta-1,3,5(10)-triene-9,17-dione monooxygenase reductase component
VTIHASDPFATPEGQRSPVRRLRSRLPAPVTIWTAGAGADRAGLTVSSVLVVDGEPGRVVGIVDDESELWDAMKATGRCAITMLHAGDHLLADRFAGLLPAPGGKFSAGTWIETGFGPVPAGATTWVGVDLAAARPYGWGLLIEATIVELHLAADPVASLAHVRGRYRELAD